LLFGLGNSASWSRSLVGGYPHVVPLEILGELGLFGFVLFAVAVLTLFLRAFTGSTRRNMPHNAVLDFAALFGCWVFALLLSCKQGTVIFSTDLLMYAVLAEKCLRISAPHQARRSQKRRVPAFRSRNSLLQ
jgi:O-antigen ligase